MKHFLRVNIYETQTILYWILGELILHLGTWHWLGWLTLGYGWFTFVATLLISAEHRSEIAVEIA